MKPFDIVKNDFKNWIIEVSPKQSEMIALGVSRDPVVVAPVHIPSDEVVGIYLKRHPEHEGFRDRLLICAKELRPQNGVYVLDSRSWDEARKATGDH
jgi:hypothetical protein